MPRKKVKIHAIPGKFTPASQAVKGKKGGAPSSESVGPAKSSAAETSQPTQVPGRWLLFAVVGTLAAAALCAWGALCLLFWQGSWQLLYHPSSTIVRTPAAAGLAFDPIDFAVTASGLPRLGGWWIPAARDARFSRYTVLYLHGQNGNLGNAVDRLAQLHAVGVNIFAFDYRGYGRSQFSHPSEQHWLEDTGWALQYLTATRHVPPASIVLDGSDLGADLALEFAAAHPQLAGVVAESPIQDATSTVLQDDRARLVPARLLVRDRYDISSAAAALRIPSLWFLPAGSHAPLSPGILQKVSARRMVVWLPSSPHNTLFSDELSRWLGDLSAP